MLYGLFKLRESLLKQPEGLNPYFFGKCSTAQIYMLQPFQIIFVLILIFLENALRQLLMQSLLHLQAVLILIFLENALRRRINGELVHESKKS